MVGSVPILVAAAALAALPPPPTPPENPITEPKRLLGKVLFFDEQLSADSTVACATCHQHTLAGGDPRRERHPGADNVFNTIDDLFGSPGVIRSDPLTNYLRDLTFGTQPQVTKRQANSPINAAYATTLFWDGRAGNQFVNPETGQMVAFADAALESQAVQPILSSIEMGHDGANWVEVIARLRAAKPLALASSLTPDLAAGLADEPDYPELFRRAFGTATISAARIGLAIATYERTLISDQTPWDRFMAGQTAALTPEQQAGWNFFRTSNCNTCHVAPVFSDGTFRNVGVRPPAEDRGQQLITGSVGDRGNFKVPSLRNVGLRNALMHNGVMTSVDQVVRFYAQASGSLPMFSDNRDPAVPVGMSAATITQVTDFLRNGLTDPRVRDGQFPFDAPTLYTQRPEHTPEVLGGGVAGTGGIVPEIIAVSPPMLGSTEFKIGLGSARGGAAARLVLAKSAPLAGVITPEWTFASQVAGGAAGAPGEGVITRPWKLTGGGSALGVTYFAQWLIDDPGAPGGVARSTVARISFFCPRQGCGNCAADMTGDGETTVQDIFEFLAAFFAGDIRADLNASMTLSVQDVFDFLTEYFTGCP